LTWLLRGCLTRRGDIILGYIREHHLEDADPALAGIAIPMPFPELLLLVMVDEENLLFRRRAQFARVCPSQMAIQVLLCFEHFFASGTSKAVQEVNPIDVFP